LIDLVLERKGIRQNIERGKFNNQKLASLTKRRGETIGFAGVGAKVFLDRAEYTLTETRSKSFHGATQWAFYRESLEWEPITPLRLFED
jgi:hypothetical protein